MANRYSVASGLASSPATWDGGVSVPVSGDRVLICAGHTVTLDGAYEWGDDSTASIVINTVTTTNSITVEGTLKASRSVSSQLTCNGNILVNSRTGVVGKYDVGTAIDPVPLGTSHKLVLNKSAAMVSGKYGFDTTMNTSFQSYVTLHGYYRKRNAILTSGLSVGAVTAIVSGSTNWQVGDQVIFAPTVSSGALDVVALTSVSDLGAGLVQIGFAATTYAHATGSPVGNLTSNVTVSSFDTTKPGWFSLTSWVSSGSAGAIHIENTRFEGLGNCAADQGRRPSILAISTNGQNRTSGLSIDPVKSCALYAPVGSTGIGLLVYQFSEKVVLEDIAICILSINSAALSFRQGARATVVGVCAYRAGDFISSAYSQGGVGVDISDSFAFGFSTIGNWQSGAKYNISNTTFGPSLNGSRLIVSNAAFDIKFSGCDIGFTYGRGLPPIIYDGLNSYGNAFSMTFDGCKFDSGLSAIGYAANNIAGSYLSVINKNNDLSLQEMHSPEGSMYRDNSAANRSASSIRLAPNSAALAQLEHAVEFPAPDGLPQRVVGYLRKNAAYGASTLPSVTISGAGITPVTFTMTNSVDTWEQFDLTATNASGSDGNFTMTFSGQSTGVGASCWLDGIYTAPFITSYRHYGFKFDAGNVARTVDPVAVLSESAAGALTGLAVDFGTSTLTISGSRTLSEIYDWCHAQLVQTANLSQPEFFTSTDGVNFACSFNVVLSGAITGSGALAMPGDTLTATGTSSVPITHNAGTFTSVSVTGYTVGARLQLLNVSTGTELYNDIPAGGTLSVNVPYTVSQTIRCRMARVVGLDADQLIQGVASLSASGAPFLLSPVADAVYNFNGIDGSTCTEFAADFPNVQIDITDPDNVTYVQRGYAWYMSGQMTADGIRYYHGAMTAEDELNYLINVDVADMHIQNLRVDPVMVLGGRLYRSDGSPVAVAGGGGVQMEYGRTYGLATGVSGLTAPESAKLMSLDTQSVNVESIHGDPVIGSGTTNDPWRNASTAKRPYVKP